MWFCPWLVGGKPIDLLLHKKDIHIRQNKNSCKFFVRAKKFYMMFFTKIIKKKEKKMHKIN